MKQYIEHDLVMLPIKNKTLIVKKRITNELKLSSLNNPQLWDNQHLYITSNDEIKEGDWVFDPIRNRVAQIREVSKKGYNFGAKKIIATTDSSLWEHDDTVPYPKTRPAIPQISQQFIEHFITEYNKGNIITKVLVEYNNGCYVCNGNKNICNQRINEPFQDLVKQECSSFYSIITNIDNTINIKPVEIKMYSREEVLTFIDKYIEEKENFGIDRNKWIEENL